MAREEDSGRTGVSRVSKTKRRENVDSSRFILAGADGPPRPGCLGGTTLSVGLSFFFPLASARFVSVVLKSSP